MIIIRKTYLFLIFLVLAISLSLGVSAGGSTFNVTHDLSANDAGDWVAASSLYTTSKANQTTIYFGMASGKLGRYSISANTTTDLSATDAGNWIATSQLYNIVAINSTIIYTGAGFGKFGRYNLSSNVWTDLSATDAGNWIGTSYVAALHNLSNTKIYIAGSSIKFGVYDYNTNILQNLSSKVSAYFSSGNPTSMEIVSPDYVYMGNNYGFFGRYSISANTTTDLSATDAGNWIGTKSVNGIEYFNNESVYIVLNSGQFGRYNISSNVATDLSATDAGDWIGTDNIMSLSVFNSSSIYIATATGKFGVYNPITNVATDLSATDAGDWIGTKSINSLTSVQPYRVYMALSGGKYGYYQAVALPDTTAPTVSSVTSTKTNGNYKQGEKINVTITFSEAVTVTGSPKIALELGSYDRNVTYLSGSGGTTLTFNYTVDPGDTSSDLDYTSTSALVLNSGTIKDAALNVATLTLPATGGANSIAGSKAIVIDTTAPTISSVSSTKTDGTYTVGDKINVTVVFSEAVTVTGTPNLELYLTGNNRNATYNAGSGTNTLSFLYTVQGGDMTPDLNYTSTTALDLNSGTIKDAALNAATLTLPTGSDLAQNKALVIVSGYTPITSVTYKLRNVTNNVAFLNLTYSLTGNTTNLDNCYLNFTDTIVTCTLSYPRCTCGSLNYTASTSSYIIPKVNSTFGVINSTTQNNLVQINFSSYSEDTSFAANTSIQRFIMHFNISNDLGAVQENITWTFNSTDSSYIINITTGAFSDGNKTLSKDWIDEEPFVIAGAVFHVGQNYSVTRYLSYNTTMYGNTHPLPEIELNIKLIADGGSMDFEKFNNVSYPNFAYTQKNSTRLAINLSPTLVGEDDTYRYTHLSTLVKDAVIAESFSDNLVVGLRSYLFNPTWKFTHNYDLLGKTIIKDLIEASQIAGGNYLGEWNKTDTFSTPLRSSTTSYLRDPSMGAGTLAHTYTDTENGTEDITWVGTTATGDWSFQVTYNVQIGGSGGTSGGGGGGSRQVLIVGNETLTYSNNLVEFPITTLPTSMTKTTFVTCTGGVFVGKAKLAPQIAQYCKVSLCEAGSEACIPVKLDESNIEIKDSEQVVVKVDCDFDNSITEKLLLKDSIQGQLNLYSATKSYPVNIIITKFQTFKFVSWLSDLTGLSQGLSFILTIFGGVALLIIFLATLPWIIKKLSKR